MSKQQANDEELTGSPGSFSLYVIQGQMMQGGADADIFWDNETETTERR